MRIGELCEGGYLVGWNDIMRINIEKLMARYPDGFSVERSEHRADGDI